MDWIENFDLILFDFDGLLVDTEHLHYKAYKTMCQTFGYDLPWDFSTYCLSAHYSSELLRDALIETLPDLKDVEWSILYEEKKKIVETLLATGEVQLMPGAMELLQALEDRKVKRCVVTNSPKEHIELITEQHPILKTIPYWFTRETYRNPKPHPECYHNAISTLCAPSDQVLGFEDTPRGLRALRGTKAKPVLITQVEYPEIDLYLRQGVVVYPSLKSLPKVLFHS